LSAHDFNALVFLLECQFSIISSKELRVVRLGNFVKHHNTILLLLALSKGSREFLVHVSQFFVVRLGSVAFLYEEGALVAP
jgi:hypothetical protein